MRKSANVTKYDIKWQILRSSVKGNYNNDLEKKFELIDKYLLDGFYYDRWERVYNWAEGLLRGFKASKDFEKQIITSDYLDRLLEIKFKFINKEFLNKDYIQYSFKERFNLWKDLFKMNKGWLDKGYFHRECNDFMDSLFQSFNEQNRLSLGIYSIDNLNYLRNNIQKINKHKFFF